MAQTIPDDPEVVCLCGSTRFKETFRRENERLTREGKIVLSVGVFGHADNTGFSDDEKEMLDELHKRKIKRADRILVLNVGGYIGDSTKSEIEEAQERGKKITFLESPYEVATQLSKGDDFQWIGEGWGSEKAQRPPNRATVKEIYDGTDNVGEECVVVESVGSSGGEFKLFLYQETEQITLYGSAQRRERVRNVIPVIDGKVVLQFIQSRVNPTKRAGVYCIYEAGTDNALYVGQSSNIWQRLSNHFSNVEGGIYKRIKDDQDTEIELSSLWEQTELRWVEIAGDEQPRRQAESAIEEHLDPKYRSI